MSTTQELRSIDTEAPRQPKTKRIVSVTAAIAVVVVVAAIALINRSGATLSPEEQLVVDRSRPQKPWSKLSTRWTSNGCEMRPAVNCKWIGSSAARRSSPVGTRSC